MTRRYVIIVPWSNRSNANSRAANFDPDVGGANTFGVVKLSTDGTDPASHTGCNTLMSDKRWSQVENVLSNLPYQTHIYRTDDRVSTPSSSVKRYDSGSWVPVGSGGVMEQALDDMALTRIVNKIM